MPPEEDEDYIDMGGAILTFYSALIDLMGRCAPDAETIKSGRSDSLRARAILRSLVSMEDLEGVLGLRFILPVSKGEVNEFGAFVSPTQNHAYMLRAFACTHTISCAGVHTSCALVIEAGVCGHTSENILFAGEVEPPGMPPGLLPDHKASIVMFMQRVYGIEDQMTFFRMLENGFLPDLRASTTLDGVRPLQKISLARFCTQKCPASHFAQHHGQHQKRSWRELKNKKL